jgi:rRNA maturation protein Nop10
MAKNKGTRPAGTAATVPVVEPVNYDKEHPKFCFRYTQNGNCPDDLSKDQQIALVLTLHRLAKIDWATIKSTGRQALGTEFIPVGQINVPVPAKFDAEERFMFFRYQGACRGVRIQAPSIIHCEGLQRYTLTNCVSAMLPLISQALTQNAEFPEISEVILRQTGGLA